MSIDLPETPASGESVAVMARQKGKIDHAEWSVIVVRHHSGESLAQIARDYGCTGPAIRYILNRTKQRSDPDLEITPFNVAKEENAAICSTKNPPDFRADLNKIDHGTGPSSGGARRQRIKGGFSPALRERVYADISVFLCTLDALSLDSNSRNIATLLRATDHLMRAAARVRIELEQLIQ